MIHQLGIAQRAVPDDMVAARSTPACPRRLGGLASGSIAAVAFIILAAWQPAVAQQPSSDADEDEYVQPLQEVFQTELVYPQDKGEVQLTVGPRKFSGGEETGEIPIAAEYGITDRWQVEVEYVAFSSVRLDPDGRARGPGDLEVGTKYAFMKIRGSDVHAAVGCNFGFPTGDVSNGLGEGLIEVEPFACIARDFPKLNRMQLFADIGVSLVNRVRARPESDEDAEGSAVATDPHEFFLDVGSFVPVGKFRGTLELNWATNQWNNHGAESAIYATPGVVWDPRPGWEFGVGVPVGVSHDADHNRVIGMIIYEFDTVHTEQAEQTSRR
jgi:hypothetical protein